MGLTLTHLVVGFLLVLIAAVLWSTWKIIVYRTRYNLHGSIPLPLFGHGLKSIGRNLEYAFKFLQDTMTEHQSPCVVWQGPVPIVFVYEAEQVQKVLMHQQLVGKSKFFEFAKEWAGEGLVSGNVATWQVHRKIITPTFNQTLLKSFIGAFSSQTFIFLHKVENQFLGTEFNIHPHMMSLSLDALCETSLGGSLGGQLEKDDKYIMSVETMFEMILWRISKIWLYPKIFFKMTRQGKKFYETLNYLRGVTMGIIEKNIRAKQNNKEADFNAKKTFISVLLDLVQEGKRLTLEQVYDETTTLMIAGNDTTGLSMSYTLLLLAMHPEIQEKAYQEVYNIYGSSDPEDVPVVYEDLARLEYVERVIKESLRLFPPGAFLARHVPMDFDLGDGHILPKNSSVVVGVFKIHRDERYWPDPLKFNPDRFLPEEVKKRHPGCYLPFSLGPRNCIGFKFAEYEMKIVLATILRRFILTKDTPESIEDIRLTLNFVLSPAQQLKVKFEKRLGVGK